MKYNFRYDEIKKIEYEGPESKNLLAFKWYDPNRIILGKKMKDWLKFSGAWWHIFDSKGGDPFGDATMIREWDKLDWKEKSQQKVKRGFELFKLLDMEYFCFHDHDLVEETDNMTEYFERVDYVVDLIEKEMKQTGIKLLWNTSNLFSHRRYQSGAGTSPQINVFAMAAAQTKHSLDIAKKLSAQGFTFWGGREGYESLLNTDVLQEEKQMAALLKMADNYASKIGLNIPFYIEPKAKEPMKHQYDFDAATSIAFIKKYNLEHRMKLNLEQNHALLAGHSFEHEIRIARINGLLGSLDSNQGDPLLGWDTDQYPYNIYYTTLAMYEIIEMGGLKHGGLNFDSKLRRQSVDFVDHLHGLIMGMDAYAKGLITAAKLHEDKVLSNFINKRYESWNSELGIKVINGEINLEEIANYAFQNSINSAPSGKQELLESIVNNYVINAK